MKYYAFFHFVDGRDVRITMPGDFDIKDSELRSRLANDLVTAKFMHFFENGKLVIVNMSNVASITVAKAE